MKQNSFLVTTLGGVALALAFSLDAQAVPTPVSGPLAGSGDGLNSRWVSINPNVVSTPHSIAGAEAVLALNSGDPGVTSFFQGVVPNVNHNDGNQLVTGDQFALRYTGFLNITVTANYQFSSTHDDGVRVRLGGEDIITYNSDTSPIVTSSSFYNLSAGLYPIEILTWEQGGQFASILSMQAGIAGAPFVIPQSLLFSGASAPDGGSSLILLSLASGLLVSRRFKS